MSNRCSAPGVGRQDRVRKAEDLVEAPIDEKVSESTREDATFTVNIKRFESSAQWVLQTICACSTFSFYFRKSRTYAWRILPRWPGGKRNLKIALIVAHHAGKPFLQELSLLPDLWADVANGRDLLFGFRTTITKYVSAKAFNCFIFHMHTRNIVPFSGAFAVWTLSQELEV